MMRIAKLVFFLFLFISAPLVPSYGDDKLKAYADLQVMHVMSTIEGIEQALNESALYLERDPNGAQKDQHEALAKYVDRTPGLRAIIVIGADGRLKIDSFTYPAKDIDLSDRAYVKAARQMKQRALYIGTPVVGRSSGAAFIPFSTSLLSADKDNIGAMAGVIHPGFLLNQESDCARCFVGVFNDRHDLMVSYPSESSYPPAFLEQIKAQKEQGMIESEINDIKFISRVDFILPYAVKVVTSKFLTNPD